MHVGMRPARKSFEEIKNQFRLQIAHQPRLHLGVDHRRGASGKIHRRQTQSLIHRHHEISGAQNASLVAQGLGESLPQHDANIFDGVVLIDIEVAGRFQFQIEAAMVREQFQHVIEEADAGGDLVASPARRSSAPARMSVSFVLRSIVAFLTCSCHLRLGQTANLLPSTSRQRLVQQLVSSRHCSVRRSQRDAHASLASRIARAVAHQNATLVAWPQ